MGIASPPAVLLPDGTIITPDIRDAERLQGFQSNWTKPAEEVGRSSLRWSLVGNALTVPVAGWIGARLNDVGTYETDRDRPLPGDGRWPKAARFDGAQRYAVEIGGCPVWCPVWNERPRLLDFLAHPGRPLSARATRGFLSRTERSTLRFVPGFKDRVRLHLSRMEVESAFAGTHDSGMTAVAAE